MKKFISAPDQKRCAMDFPVDESHMHARQQECSPCVALLFSLSRSPQVNSLRHELGIYAPDNSQSIHANNLVVRYVLFGHVFGLVAERP